MKVLVTGSSGFIGAATVKYLLDAGVSAWGFDHKHGEDVRSPRDVFAAVEGVDAVIHLAGVLGTDELFDMKSVAIDVNLKGAINVLDACKRYDVAFVGITMPGAESGWANLYQATKIAAQTMATAYHRDYGVRTTHIKAFNAYGPGQAHGPGHPQKIFPTFAYNLWRNLPCPVWGTGHQTVDLVHVDHVARMLGRAAIVSASDGDRAQYFGHGEVYDAGTGEELQVVEVIQAISEVIGVVPTIEYLPMRRGETAMTRLKATNPGPFGFDRLTVAKLVEAADYYKP